MKKILATMLSVCFLLSSMSVLTVNGEDVTSTDTQQVVLEKAGGVDDVQWQTNSDNSSTITLPSEVAWVHCEAAGGFDATGYNYLYLYIQNLKNYVTTEHDGAGHDQGAFIASQFYLLKDDLSSDLSSILTYEIHGPGLYKFDLTGLTDQQRTDYLSDLKLSFAAYGDQITFSVYVSNDPSFSLSLPDQQLQLYLQQGSDATLTTVSDDHLTVDSKQKGGAFFLCAAGNQTFDVSCYSYMYVDVRQANGFYGIRLFDNNVEVEGNQFESGNRPTGGLYKMDLSSFKSDFTKNKINLCFVMDEAQADSPDLLIGGIWLSNDPNFSPETSDQKVALNLSQSNNTDTTLDSISTDGFGLTSGQKAGGFYIDTGNDQPINVSDYKYMYVDVAQSNGFYGVRLYSGGVRLDSDGTYESDNRPQDGVLKIDLSAYRFNQAQNKMLLNFVMDESNDKNLEVAGIWLSNSDTMPVTGFVLTPPQKTSYIQGQALDLTGGSIQQTFNNDISVSVPMNYTGVSVQGYDSQTVGSQQVTVSYLGQSANFEAQVAAKAITGLTVSKQPTNTTYIAGNNIDLTGGVLTASYNDGTTQDIPMTDAGVAATGYDASQLGNQTVTFSYGGATTTLTVTVANKMATGIAVKTQPENTTFVQGTSLDLTGGVLSVSYNDGSSEDLSVTADGVTVTGYNKDSVGEQTLTVSYEGQQTTLKVNVIARAVTGITVLTQPTQTAYYTGHDLDLAGGTIHAIYNDGSAEDVSMTASGVTVSGYDKNTAGQQALTVTYQGKTASFTVNVTAVAATALSVKTAPATTTYYKGSSLDLSGGILTVTYNDGTSADVNMNATGVTVTGYDKDSVGEQTLTVSCQDQTATFTVTVKANDVASIAIKSAPSQTEYVQGYDLDLDGAAITATYENGQTADVQITSDMVSGFDKDKAGDQTVTVTYESKTATFTVTVISNENVNQLITAIDVVDLSTLTLDDKDAVSALKASFDALSPVEQAAVTNKAKLDQLLAKIDQLSSQNLGSSESSSTSSSSTGSNAGSETGTSPDTGTGNGGALAAGLCLVMLSGGIVLLKAKKKETIK